MATASNWRAALINCRYEPRIFIILLALARFLVVLWPQTGYLHPDEFFQGPDIVAGSTFNSKIAKSWEHTVDKPIRCMLVPYILNNLSFKLVKLLQDKPTAYLLLIAPRLVYTLLSFTIDYSLFKLCQYYSTLGLWYLPISIIFQSSFACLGLLTRTLSNTAEVIIFALLLSVLCQALRKKFRVVFVTPGRSTPIEQQIKPEKQFTSSVLIGSVTTLGVFNWPTFVCFAIVPLLFWLKETYKMHSCNLRKTIRIAIAPLAISFILTFIVISTFDTMYYKGFYLLKDLFYLLIDKKIEKFYEKLKSEWVLTPYNFMVYNTNVENLAQFGLHLPFTHAIINLPILFGILGFKFYEKIIQISRESSFRRLILSTHRMYSMMIFIVLVSIILLSFIPHQEIRFLLPLIVPMVYSFAFTVYGSKKNLAFWLITNFVLICFYTSFHQSGTLRATLDLDPIIKKHELTEMSDNKTNNQGYILRVVALGCYPIPSYLWNVRSDDPRFEFDVYEKTFKNVELSLKQEFHQLVRANRLVEIDRIYIMMPSVYLSQLETIIKRKNLKFELTITAKELQRYNLNYNFEHLTQSWAEFRSATTIDSFKRAVAFSLFEISF